MRQGRRAGRVLGAACLALATIAPGLGPASAWTPARTPQPPAMAAEDAQPQAPRPDAALVRPGEVIVKTTRSDASIFGLAAVRGRVAAALGRRTHLVEVPAGQESAAAQRLASDPSVVYAEPNYVRTPASHPQEMTWGVRRTRSNTVWSQTTGKGVRVAIVDSGVDPVGQLAGRVSPGFDAYGAAGLGRRDDCGHGTAVAGVAAAAHDGAGTVGVAPEAVVVPVRVLRHDAFFGMCVGDDASIVKGLNWLAARGNADVVNLSLSGPQPSRALADAIAALTAGGSLVVAAAGNAGDRTLMYPAAYSNVVSVGGLRRSSAGLAWWRQSSFGKVDVAAPAVGIPVLRARGVPAAAVGRPCPAADGHALCADGTSFAAPHVAGIAALLHKLPGVGPASARERVLRLRQWLLATAPDVSGVRSGVSLQAGHGAVDAAAAAAARGGGPLVTWRTGARMLAPKAEMRVLPSAQRLTVVATHGTGAPLAGRGVTLRAPSGTSLSVLSGQTDAAGELSTVLRSRAGGRRPVIAADVEGTSLPIEMYVLQHDENVPGVRLPAAPPRNRLDATYDVDDVFRVRLAAGETLRADARGVDPRREFIDLYLHRGTTSDVTNPRLAPLREQGASFESNPRRLRVRVTTKGLRYLDVYGRGSYRLVWWVNAPGKVRNASADPARFSPNGDGVRDRTAIRWRVARRGTVVLRVRNTAGKVVRTVRFGTMARGVKTYRWNGRNGRGRVVRDGRFRVTLHWSGAGNRRASTSTRVVVDR